MKRSKKPRSTRYFITWKTSIEIFNNYTGLWERKVHETSSEFWAFTEEEARKAAKESIRSTLRNSEQNFPNKFRNAKFLRITKVDEWQR